MTAEGRTSEPNWRLWQRRGWRLAGFPLSSPLSKPTEISQTEMWIVNSACKVAFFPPKVTAKMLTIFGGSRSGWDVKPFESTLPTKGNEEGLYLFSWDWPNSKHQSHWIKAHTPLTGTAINPVFSPPTESPPDNAIPTKAFPATAERELDYTAVTKWLETPQHSTLLATKQEDYPI